MALEASVYDQFMFTNMKSILDEDLIEAQRNKKSVNGILEASLTNNLMNLQRMDITEAAAVSSVIRNDLSPQIAAMAGALSALRDVIRTAQPPV